MVDLFYLIGTPLGQHDSRKVVNTYIYIRVKALQFLFIKTISDYLNQGLQRLLARKCESGLYSVWLH